MSNEKFRFQTFKGKALLEKLPGLSHLPHHERAKQCGYSTIMYVDNGRQKIQLNLSDFYDAILEARKQEGHQPKRFDAVLGGQTPPVESVVLGGIEGVKHRFKSTIVEARVAALSKALNYGEAGLDLVIGALKDSSAQVRNYAYQLLQKRSNLLLQGRSDSKVKKALLEFDRLLLFTTLQDWKIENFNPQIGITDSMGTAYTVKSIEQFKLLLQDPRVSQLQALVCQYLDHYYSYNEQYRYVVDVLFDAYEQLTSLKALCIGNDQERNPLGDISAILKVYPNLEVLQVSGDCDVDFSPGRHNHLKTLIVNTRIDNETISRICELELPELEYLDLGCSNDYYHNDKFNIKVLMPIVSGKLFPKLRYLGIRGGQDYNKIVSHLVRSTIVNHLLVLDLSDGNLGDKGAEALLNCPAINRLHTLNVSKNSLSSQMVKRLSGLKCRVIAKSQKFYRYSSVFE